MLDLSFFSRFHTKPSQVSRGSRDVTFGAFPEGGVYKPGLLSPILRAHAIGTTAAVTVVGLRKGSCLTLASLVFWGPSFVTRVHLDRGGNLERICS